MIVRSVFLYLMVLSCITLCLASCTQKKSARPRTAPDFTLLDQQGKPITLSSLLPHYAYVVLVFYPQDESFVCTKQMCQLRDLYADLPSDVILLGISSNSPAQHMQFIQKYHLPFSLLSDPDNTVRTLYKAYTIGAIPARMTLVIDGTGTIVESHNAQLSLSEHINLVRRLAQKK